LCIRAASGLCLLVASIHWSIAAPAVAFGGALLGSCPASLVTLKERVLFLTLAVSLRIFCMLSNYLHTGNMAFIYLPMILLPCAVGSFAVTTIVVHRSARHATTQIANENIAPVLDIAREI